METREGEEGAAEQRLAPGIAERCHVFVDDQVPPLGGVQDDERQAAGHGGEDPFTAAALRLPWCMAWTAITIVRLLESRQKVMIVEKIMLGEK